MSTLTAPEGYFIDHLLSGEPFLACTECNTIVCGIDPDFEQGDINGHAYLHWCEDYIDEHGNRLDIG